jgi:four helix bundle protein
LNKSQRFTDLIVWQKSHILVLTIYKMTTSLTKDELYGLTSRAISIPANIADKKGIKDKVRYFYIAQGSLEELKYYLILINDQQSCDARDIKPIPDEVGKILNGYIEKYS